MSIIPKKNPNDLTEDEVKFLRGSRVPAEVKAMLPRDLSTMGTAASALRKVAAAMNAEADAIHASLDLAQLHGELSDLADTKQRLAEAQKRNQALEATISHKDQRIMHLTAGPAMAVSGD